MMQPGRELDALIAEKVMGWTLVKGPFGNPVTGRIFDEGWRNQDGNMYFEFPYYSTNIADAWEVVEKLKEQHHVTVTTPCDEVRDYACTVAHYGYRRFQDQVFVATGQSAPYAICLAALGSVGVDVSA